MIAHVSCLVGVPHRLELSLKDALNSVVFKEVNNIILRLYYLYKESLKKLRQLQELVEIYQESN